MIARGIAGAAGLIAILVLATAAVDAVVEQTPADELAPRVAETVLLPFVLGIVSGGVQLLVVRSHGPRHVLFMHFLPTVAGSWTGLLEILGLEPPGTGSLRGTGLIAFFLAWFVGVVVGVHLKERRFPRWLPRP